MGMKRIECLGIGRKDVYIIQMTDGSWGAICSCNALYAMVKIPLTAGQSREILSGQRRNINEVLLDVAKQLREVFITGTTPAEWDLMMFGKVRPVEDYEKLCYEFQSVMEWMFGQAVSGNPVLAAKLEACIK